MIRASSFAVLLAACVSNHAVVSWPTGHQTFTEATGRYCEHCAGGPEWSFGFARAGGGRPEHLEVKLTHCAAGEVRGDAEHRLVSLSSGKLCKSAVVRVVQCHELTADISFEADCDGGQHVEGHFDGPLTNGRGSD